MITEYKIVCEGVKKKTIYHFSDTHLTEFDELSSDEEKEKAAKMTEAWERVRAEFARVGGEPYDVYERQPYTTHFTNLLKIAEDGDALVIAGDMLDFSCGGNIRFAEKELAKFSKPYVSVCGNHESRKSFPDSGPLACMGKAIQTVDLGDMLIIGVDNSQRIVTNELNEELEKLLSAGKKAMIVLHVPIMCEGNEQKLKKSGVYFQFNYEGCPKENLEFINIIEKHAENVIAVLAGHLHYSNYALLPGSVPQFVSSQGIVGDMNKYVIGGMDELF